MNCQFKAQELALNVSIVLLGDFGFLILAKIGTLS